MKLEHGKYYKTRDGRKAGPVDFSTMKYPKVPVEGLAYLQGYRENGLWGCSDSFGWGTDPRDIVEEWVEEKPMDIYNIDKTWGELSPEEKGALLLHYHEGGKVEVYIKRDGWTPLVYPCWEPEYMYRAKKAPVVTLDEVYYHPTYGFSNDYNYPYKVTVTRLDGEPDCGSIQMEKL
jgi:hypothetical protein